VCPLPAEVAGEKVADPQLAALPQLTLLHQAAQAQPGLAGPATADTTVHHSRFKLKFFLKFYLFILVKYLIKL